LNVGGLFPSFWRSLLAKRFHGKNALSDQNGHCRVVGSIATWRTILGQAHLVSEITSRKQDPKTITSEFLLRDFVTCKTNLHAFVHV